jgi:hypothetical protein
LFACFWFLVVLRMEPRASYKLGMSYTPSPPFFHLSHMKWMLLLFCSFIPPPASISFYAFLLASLPTPPYPRPICQW